MKKGRDGSILQGRFGSQRSRSKWTQASDFAPARLSGGRGVSTRATLASSWSWRFIVPLWLGAAGLGAAYGVGTFGTNRTTGAAALAPGGPQSGVRANFSLCHTGGGYNCVVDGDTIWLEGLKIRIADIDAPETHQPRCTSEKALGDRATQRLKQLLNGGAVTLQSIYRDEDRHGRKLRLIMVNGGNVGDVLVREGLACPYAGGRKPWC